MAPTKADIKLKEEVNKPFLGMFFTLMRPKQWTKNVLVFAALIFSIRIANVDMLGQAFTGFILFCLVSSCVYILNDYVDRDRDRMHPEKKNRPLASGALNPQMALANGIVLLAASFLLLFAFIHLLDLYCCCILS